VRWSSCAPGAAVSAAVIGVRRRKPGATGRGKRILPPILKMNYWNRRRLGTVRRPAHLSL